MANKEKETLKMEPVSGAIISEQTVACCRLVALFHFRIMTLK
jgi:hypothetical protein